MLEEKAAKPLICSYLSCWSQSINCWLITANVPACSRYARGWHLVHFSSCWSAGTTGRLQCPSPGTAPVMGAGLPVLLWELPPCTGQFVPLRRAQRAAQAAPSAAEGSVQPHLEGESQGCVCTEWEGHGWLWSYSDFQWQLSTIHSSTLGFPPLSFAFTVLMVMSLPCQDDKALHPCAPGVQFAATAQSSSWHFMSSPWCITALGCALHSSAGLQHTTINKAERVALGCLKHSICASPSSLDRHS